MLARVLTNCFYKNVADLAMDIAGVLRRQLELIEADTVQLDEACIAGLSGGRTLGGGGHQSCARRSAE